jgi:hypothetical protein
MQLVVATYERFLLGYSLTLTYAHDDSSTAAAAAAAAAGGGGGEGAHANGSSSSARRAVACELRRAFTHAAHQGPVRCVAAGGPWCVSGGQDDQLHIYDLKV